MLDPAALVQIYTGLASTVIGGIVLTLLFFVFKEQCFCPPALSGVWECQLIVEKTANNPFRGMQVWYRVSFLQDGHSFFGEGEKDREVSMKGSARHTGKSRIHIQVRGIVEKRLTGPDSIRVQWKENGDRVSSTTLELRLSGDKKTGSLVGTYYTTAGECRGKSYWHRIS
jgi:hypothetical protein